MTQEFDPDGLATLPSSGPPDPKQLGSCRIEARIAAGPGSRVYRAVDLALGRTVVVKMLSPELDSDLAGRFLEAASKLKGLKHENVVEVLGSGMDGTSAYAVFEYLDATDLDVASRREQLLVPAAAARVILDVASGMLAAHERGVLHGDIRPRHFLRHRGATKVTGFGLTPPVRTAQGRRVRGHPAYVSPEVAQGGKVSVASDVYSLGASLYELVTGRPPFGASGADALLACAVHEPFPTFAAGGVKVPAPLEDLLARMVAKAPTKRFGSFVELLQAGAAILPALRRLVAAEPSVVVEDGRQAGLQVAIPEGDFLLGRVPGEGIAIDDARISRRHAMIRRKGDYLEVEDLRSRNGIRVNGAETRARQLFPGDRIEIGDTVLRIEGARATVTVDMHAVPASPVRGAFGDVEIARSPGKQAGADALSRADGPAAVQRLQILGRLAPLLAQRPNATLGELSGDVLIALGDALGADDRVFVRVERSQIVLDAKSGAEAQVLSCVLPALERALPGQLSLLTSVRAGEEDRWGVLLSPIAADGQVRAFVVLVKRQGSFDEEALTSLEAAGALLAMRVQAATSPPRE